MKKLLYYGCLLAWTTALLQQAADGAPEESITCRPTSIYDALRYGRAADIGVPALLLEKKRWIQEGSNNQDCKSGYKALLEGRWSDAIADYDKAVEKNPINAFAVEYRGISRQLGLLGNRNPLVIHQSTEWDTGPLKNPRKAILSDYDAAIKMHPDCARLYRNRSIMHLWLNDDPKTILADSRRALELAPDDVACLLTAGDMTALYARPDDAIPILNHAIARYPHSSLFLTNRGRFLWRVGKFTEAVADETKALKYEPDSVTTMREMSLAYFTMHQPEKAIAELSKAIAMNPDFLDLWNLRAGMECNSGHFQAAIADCNQALERGYIRKSEIYFTRGHSYMRLGQFNHALADLNHALALSPRMAKALKDRAIVETMMGKGSPAMADINASLAIDPSSSDALGVRARISKKFGAYDQAVLDSYDALKQSAADNEVPIIDQSKRSFGRTVFSNADRDQSRKNARILQRGVSPNQVVLDKEILRYSQIIALDDTRAEAYYNRGLLHMCKQQPKLALADFEACIKRCNSGPSQLANSSRCLSIICAQKIGVPPDAPSSTSRRGDARSASNCAAIAQPPQVRRPMLDAVQDFLHHKLTGADLLNLAINKHDSAVAHFYIGEVGGLSGDVATAQTNLKWVQDNADIESDEYMLANAELEHMVADKQ